MAGTKSRRKLEAYAETRAIDRRAVQLMREKDLSFSQAWLYALIEHESAKEPEDFTWREESALVE